MKIILLSGGSGKRLWPLSNESRSKQFLQLLTAPDGSRESMIQRMERQIREALGDEAEIIIATSQSQYDSIINQLGGSVEVVTEPERRDTFPAIALSASYLIKEKKSSLDEVVVVMPSDSYVESGYFESIARMAKLAQREDIEMVLMGISPTEPSTKFGYIVPTMEQSNNLSMVERFTEKPNEDTARELIAAGAVWNGGVFAFKLGYIASIIDEHVIADSFSELRARYSEFKKISFDYEVVERAARVAFVPYSGEWSDLGTWDSLSAKIQEPHHGRVLGDDMDGNNHIINELPIPVISLGCRGMIIAASLDGILVSRKESSTELKGYADTLHERPMYEERLWGSYKIMGMEELDDGHRVLTKYLNIDAGCGISYQHHLLREEVWTVVNGRGILVKDGILEEVRRGSVVHIKAGVKHAIKSIEPLQIIEVQSGAELSEEDVIRSEWTW